MDQSSHSGDLKVKDVLNILGAEKDNVVSGVYIDLFVKPRFDQTLAQKTDAADKNLYLKKGGDEEPVFFDDILKNRDQAQFYNFSEVEFKENAKIVQANYQRTNNINKIATPSWIKENIPKISSSFPKPNYDRYKGKTPVEIFELFFDVVTINLMFGDLLDEKHGGISPFTPEHIKKCLGILLLSGYNKISKPPGCYWEYPDVRNELIAKSMHPKRFQYIIDEFLSKFCTVNMCSFLMLLLKKRFYAFLPPEEVLSYNECMLDNFRRHDCKEMRHVPFGYRVSCLNTPSGYLVDFYLHGNFAKKDNYENKFGEAATPLLEMLDELLDRSKTRDLPYTIYFGNLDTDTSFLHEIKLRGYTPVGIFSNKRVLKEFEPTNYIPHKVNSIPHGYYDVSKNMLIANMERNSKYKIVTTLCNKTDDPPLVLENYARMLINNYEESINGTDTMNKHIELYKTEIFNRKEWFWPVLSWLLDVTVHNAWLLMKKAGSDISQLDFRRSIVCAYLDENYKAPA